MNEESKRNPSAHFADPADVLTAAGLSRADRVEVLTNWANELRQLQVAEEENMRGAPGLAARLQAVEKALLSLGAEDVDHDAKS